MFSQKELENALSDASTKNEGLEAQVVEQDSIIRQQAAEIRVFRQRIESYRRPGPKSDKSSSY